MKVANVKGTRAQNYSLNQQLICTLIPPAYLDLAEFGNGTEHERTENSMPF